MDEHEAAALDDDRLMARVARHDRAAFGDLASRHLGSVHRYLTRMTGSHADADDLTQETFLRLWLNAGRYRPGAARLTTWLHRIAHNLAVDELRKRRTVPYPAPGAAEPDGDAAAAGDPTATAVAAAVDEPDIHLETQQTRQRLAGALARLPSNQRAALLLRQVQGFTQEEAAQVLGVSVSSLESLVARARRTLRTHIQTDPGSATERPT